jgi:hypothetical protein
MAQKQKIAGVHSRKRKGVDYWYARIDSRIVYFGKRLSNRASSYDPRGKLGSCIDSMLDSCLEASKNKTPNISRFTNRIFNDTKLICIMQYAC